MDFKERISVQFTNLTKTDKKISNYLIQNPEFLTGNSVQGAAKLMNTSPAALVRLAQKIGYKGLADFKMDLENYEKDKPNKAQVEEATVRDQVLANYRDTIDIIQGYLREEELIEVARIVLEANRVRILGIGSSGLRAEEMVYLLLYQDVYTESITSKTKMLYLARNLSPDDVLIFYTVSGNKDFQELFRAAKDVGAKIIILTMVDNPYVHKYADHLFVLPSNLQQLTNTNGEFYQMDNRLQFSIFSEILAAYINQKLK